MNLPEDTQVASVLEGHPECDLLYSRRRSNDARSTENGIEREPEIKANFEQVAAKLDPDRPQIWQAEAEDELRVVRHPVSSALPQEAAASCRNDAIRPIEARLS
jgi:hypothetical protein